MPLLIAAIHVYWVVILVRCVFSFLPPEHRSGDVYLFLLRLTEPVLAPVRRILPTAGGLDFSPMRGPDPAERCWPGRCRRCEGTAQGWLRDSSTSCVSLKEAPLVRMWATAALPAFSSTGRVASRTTVTA